MEPELSRALNSGQRRAWDGVLKPIGGELTAGARETSVEVTRAIGQRLPDLLADRESFEANRASTEASILGFAQILEQGADPAGASLGAATLAYTQEGAQRGIPLTTLIRSYRLGHAAAWDRIMVLIAAHAGGLEQRAIATELCSAWLFAYVDAALYLAEDFYGAEREGWVRSTAATRAETIDTILAGGRIDTALASRRLGYELERQHTAVMAWLQAHEEGFDTHTAIATADLDQARIFVARELQGLAGTDDLTTRLTATLTTYLDERSSRSRTAKRLGIHENTVTYRINQAEEILGRGVDQGSLELRVALANLVRDQTG